MEVTKEDLTNLKNAINKSLKELVRLHLSLKGRLDGIEERMEIFNRRAGHKI